MPNRPLDVLDGSPTIWDEIELPCGLRLRNRLAKAAMTENIADPKTNSPNTMHAMLYKRWGECEAGLLITGNVQVDMLYLECPGNVVVENDRDLTALTNWANKSQANGSAVIVQISHPGRQCPISVCDVPVAPSSLPPVKAVLPLFKPSRALTLPEIEDVVRRFATTASVLHRAGFAGIQVHSAHGYLLSQFLSPLTNHRTDKYGGTAENRRRLLREIILKIRENEGPNFAIAVKLNSADFQKGGFSMSESFDVVRMLCDLRVDLIEISGGTYEAPELLRTVVYDRESTRDREAFFMEYVTNMHQTVMQEYDPAHRVPIMLTGGFRTPQGMAAALRSGVVDIIGMARPFATEPSKVASLLRSKSADSDVTFFSPLLRVPFLSKMDAGLQNLWHQRQIERLALGLEPDMNLGIVYCLCVQAVMCYVVSPRHLTHMVVVKIAAYSAAAIAFITVSIIFYAMVR